MVLNLTEVIVAAVASIPATVAALNSRKTKRQTDTGNGRKLGELVRALDVRLRRVETKLDTAKTVLDEKEKA